MVGYEVRNFDEVEFQTSTFKEYDLAGRGTRQYTGAGAVPQLRQRTGGQRVCGAVRLITHPAAGQWTNFLASLSSTGRDFIKKNRSEYVTYAAEAGGTRTGTFQKGNTTVRLVSIEWTRDDRDFKSQQGTYIAVDVLETKAMEPNMVVVAASDTSKSMTANGKVTIDGILFDTGKADVKPESKPSLDEIAAFLKAEPTVTPHVVGHTDSVGGFDSNLGLSKRRADAVAAALAKDYGIAASRVVGNRVASLAPVANNSSDEGRAKNWRVELVLQ